MACQGGETVKKEQKSKLSWLWENMKGYQALYALSLAGTIVYNVMQLTVPYVSQSIIDLFLSGEQAAENLATKRDLFWKLVIAMVVLTFVRTAFVYLSCMGCEVASQKTLYRIRMYLFDKIERQDMHFYATYRTGDLMTRMTGDLDAVRHMIAWVIRTIVEAVALMGATAVYFFYMDWRLALCMFAIAPFIFLIIVLFKNKVAPRHKALREKLAEMNTIAQENISGNRVVKAFDRENHEIGKFDECNTSYSRTNQRTALTWLTYYPYVESFANLMPVVLLLVGGIFLIRDQISMGQYVAFSSLIWAIANPMRQMGNIMNEFQRFSAASEKVMEIYYSEPEIVDRQDAIDRPERFEGRIEFKNVSFRYSDGKLPVLHNVSFTAEPGETVAIMGETGCGKTSLIQLIPRFYEPTEGE
ncbi:MAG: ATP-binding cassette domain-containing protein, partial [Acetatifactor sp.]|nr:ATP-binding cassette domain-containing protein [Acetatifactor sp.]